jgi:hypothetical protein
VLAARIAAISVCVVALASFAATATASSVPEFRKAAAAVCTKTRAELTRESKRSATLREYLLAAAPIGHKYLARISALDPPASMRRDHATAVSFIRREIALFDVMARKVRAGADAKAVLQANTAAADKLDTGENAAWGRMGVRACL